MKKILYFFTCLSSILLFFNVYDAYSEYQFNSLHALSNYISGLYEFPVSTAECHFSSEAEWEELIQFVYEHDYIVIAGTNFTQESGRKMDQSYLYIPDSYKIDCLQEKDGNTIDFSKKEIRYMTTDLADTHRDGIIDVLNEEYYQDYQDILEAHTFASIQSLSKTQDGVIVFFVTDQIQALKDDIRSADLSCMDEELIMWNETPDPIPFFDSFSSQIVLYVSIGLALSLICLVFFQQKEIVIRKMFGQSTMHILHHLYMPILLMMCLCFSIPYMLCFFWKVHSLRSVSMDVSEHLLKMYGLFLFLAFGVCFFLYLGIHYLQQYITLKKRENVRSIQYTSSILKLLFLVTLVMPMVEIKDQISRLVPEYQAYVTHPENYQGYIHFNGYNMMSMQAVDFESVNELLCEYMNENHAILADFFASMYVEEDEWLPYIRINQEYIKNQRLDLDVPDSNVLLVPKKFKDVPQEVLMQACLPDTCEIRSVENGSVYYGFHPVGSGARVESPIVLIQTEIDNAMTPDIYFAKDQEDEVKEFLRTSGQEDAFQIIETTNAFIFAKGKAERMLMNVGFLLALYIVLLILFQVQNVYIHFLESEKKKILLYMFGYTFIQRQKPLFIEAVCVYILGLAISFIRGYPMMQVLSLMLGAFLLDMICMVVVVRLMEKRNAIRILKGGSE